MEVGLHQPLSFVFPKASWIEEDSLSPFSVEVVQYAMLKVVIVPCMHASKSIWELLKSGFYYYNQVFITIMKKMLEMKLNAT